MGSGSGRLRVTGDFAMPRHCIVCGERLESPVGVQDPRVIPSKAVPRPIL